MKPALTKEVDEWLEKIYYQGFSDAMMDLGEQLEMGVAFAKETSPFMMKDVKWCRRAIAVFLGRGPTVSPIPSCVLNLADRIEALLPPEKP